MVDSSNNKSRIIFDPIYGFIRLTPVEWEIIHTPFYQRLRWIKQLGFSFYVFPGAEHSRFGHSIGVMYNAHKILESCGKAVSMEELLVSPPRSDAAKFHQSIRLGALMHDLGTFMFSHTTESAYIRFGETTNQKKGKGLKDDHENLGSFIIKNTDYDGGITQILLKYGYDPQMVSDLVKGVDPSALANQILHAEIDCDRMDYLLRDAHYTGLKYGSYDRDYLLHHFRVKNIGDEEILTIKANALHCVADFLLSRFAWYSQVIRSPRGAKYDAIAERLCFHFLEKGVIHKYSDLLEMISNDPNRFYGFNDNYFMGVVHTQYSNGNLDKYPEIKDMAYTLLLEKGAKTVRAPEFSQCLLDQDQFQNNLKIIKKAEAKVQELTEILQKKGNKSDWIIPDLPQKQIKLINSRQTIVKGTKGPNVLLERDPVKIAFENGDVKLLADVEHSVISKLQKNINYIPNVFCSHSAFEILVREGVIDGEIRE